MPFSWKRHQSVEEFLAAAGAFLEQREAENNLVFGISSAIRTTPELFAADPPCFATVTDAGGRIVAATLRTPPHNEAVADRWVAQVGRIAYVWENAGEAVSLVGAGGETPNGIRIGPVYTPPERRNHGYASALTAAASADQLQRGRRFVFLFTDLANPTSNKIYRAIGYEPVCDMDMYHFGSDA